MRMKKKKIVSLALALALALGLAVPSLAAGQTFSDVPESYWGYADIEAVAQAGYMNGTGNGAFSPEMKVSVAQFLTLLGRLVFPDVKTEGSDWFGPYVSAAQEAGLLTGSQVNVNQPEAEISRYDMAVILRAAAKKLGVAEKSAQSSEVTDYGLVPTMYADAVLAVYGMGLIRGDQAGNFNGSNTMMRAEVATVIMRLAKAKPSSGSQSGIVIVPNQPEKPSESQTPDSTEPVHIALYVRAQYALPLKEAPSGTGGHMVIRDQVPVQVRYTENAGQTFTVLTEGFTTYFSGNSSEYTLLEFDVTDEMIQSGQFYISGEVNYEGVLYATHDRRTDGHAQIVPFDPKKADRDGFVNIEVVPPATGVWRTVTLNQFYGRMHIQGNLKAQCRYYPDSENVTPDGGILLAEALVDEDGYYHMEFKIDSIDFDTTLLAYKIFIFDADTGEFVGNGSSLTNLRELTSTVRGYIE